MIKGDELDGLGWHEEQSWMSDLRGEFMDE